MPAVFLSDAAICARYVSLHDDPNGLSTNAQIIKWINEQCTAYGYLLTDEAKRALERYEIGYREEQLRENSLQAAE